RAQQLAGVLLQLLLEPLEQRESIGGRAGEAADHLALGAEAADLAGIRLHHRVAHRDLPVAGDDGLAALLHADDGGAVPLDKAPRLAGAGLSIVHAEDMGQRRWRFNPSSGWRRRSAPRAAAHAGRADLSDVAEQV